MVPKLKREAFSKRETRSSCTTSSPEACPPRVGGESISTLSSEFFREETTGEDADIDIRRSWVSSLSTAVELFVIEV